MSPPYTYPSRCAQCCTILDREMETAETSDGQTACSQECADEYDAPDAPETESQIEAVMFVGDGQAPDNLFTGGISMDKVIRIANENEEQARFLEREGELQEAREVAFCKGMLVGGAIALTVLAVTLWLVGVI